MHYQLIIVIRGQHDQHSRDIWWVDHTVAGIIEEQAPVPAPTNIWDALATRTGDQLVRNYAGRD